MLEQPIVSDFPLTQASFPHGSGTESRNLGHKKKIKVVSKKINLIKLVLREDIHLNEIIMTSETTLVERFIGRRVNDDGLKR